MERSVAGSRRDSVVTTERGGARDSHDRGPSRVSHVATQLEHIRTVVVDDHEDIARLVANRIATLIREHDAAGERTVLGLATGSTPIGVYRELIRMHQHEDLSFANVVTFNLDEYYPMAKDSIHSYHRFMWENLFSQIDIRPENVHIPPGDLPRRSIVPVESISKYLASARRVTSASMSPVQA
jgi:6-phosphogluconolactonase/glucosamine-6-phosphate isomerase/deaminase